MASHAQKMRPSNLSSRPSTESPWAKIIPAEDPNSDYILKHFGRQRLSHVQRNIGSAGWLAGHLYSTIEWLKKRISKSGRFCTSGSNLVLNVIQCRFGALAGWLTVAGWPAVTGCLAGRGWRAGRGWLGGWLATGILQKY